MLNHKSFYNYKNDEEIKDLLQNISKVNEIINKIEVKKNSKERRISNDRGP